MAINPNLDPLERGLAIVDRNGAPTPYFMQQWAKARNINIVVDGVVTSVDEITQEILALATAALKDADNTFTGDNTFEGDLIVGMLLRRLDEEGVVVITGGLDDSAAANIRLFGATHAMNPSVIQIREGSLVILQATAAGISINAPLTIGKGWKLAEQNYTSSGTVGTVPLSDEASILRCTTPATLTIEGISGGSAGRRITILNVGDTNDIIIKHLGAFTPIENVACPGGLDLTIGPFSGRDLVYDDTENRWQVI